MKISRAGALGGALLVTAALACGSNPAGPGEDQQHTDAPGSGGLGAGTGSAAGTDLGTPADGGTDLVVDGGETGGLSGGGAGPWRVRVLLVFAFDVSGSMGKLDEPNWWHDPTKKWTPVVSATSAFFESPASAGITASLTLFPADEDSCESTSYLEPTLPMTDLPSADFATVFADYEEEVGSPLAGGDWRGGTPTYAATLGVSEYLSAILEDAPEAQGAVVLVTDGLPQGCDEGLDDVVQLVGDLLSQGLPTYVIGIENPTEPPGAVPEGWDDWGECDSGSGGADTPCTPPTTLSALNELAEAGGTGAAFLIDTGDVGATESAFQAAIESIRSAAVSCTLLIPPHPQGGSFEADKIDVAVTSQGVTSVLPYDEDCTEGLGWHFDDPALPNAVELCSEACSSVQASDSSTIDVNFLCEPRVDVVK
jgi:hypothetical protein